MKKTLLYYISIGLSVIDVLVGCLAGYKILVYYLVKNRLLRGVTPIQSITIYIVLLTIAIIAYFPFDLWRRKLRDESEYDSNGLHKKYSNFSKLSASERKKIEEKKMISAELILDSATLKKITQKGEINPEKAMDELIGLTEVKRQMNEMAARMKFESEHNKKKKQRKTMHMCFFGPPGTGKTTTARIMTGFLYKYGYIRKNQCIEVDGNFLKGATPGESSKKTAMLIQKSLGGVLFIDEAYALLQKNGDNYGQESIATIVKAMEDNRDDLIIILAGYSKEMKELINSNPGIESRIKYYMDFGNYSTQELLDVFRFMANKEGFVTSQGILEKFEIYIAKEAKLPNFGNARTVRTVLEKIIDKHALNIMNKTLNKESTFILEAVDMPDTVKNTI